MTFLRRRTDDGPARPPLGEPALSARGLSVDRSTRRILRDIDIDLIAGEVLVLVGPNGAGKSTLLAALAGDIAPSTGTVTIEGRNLNSWSTVQLARRRAVLPQHHTAGFSFTSEQIVRMGRAPWTRTAASNNDDAFVADAMTECDVTQFSQRPFASLSGGERARVALARVLAQHTVTLMLDEPTSALDLGHQENVMTTAKRRAADGCAVVVVLHDLGLAAAYADRIVVLDSGAVAAMGPPRSVLHSELLTRVYGYEVDVFDHPRTGAQLVLPHRG